MKPEELLANISRDFLKVKNVSRYRMKKVVDMNDREVISNCHCYCEDNNLTDEWYVFREKAEYEYRYCAYLEEYIDEGLCCDLQMITKNYIKESFLSKIKIDKEQCVKCCSECKFSL